MKIDKDFLGKLFEQATMTPQLRQCFDLRTSEADTSQRMLIALLPGTVVPIHKHEDTTESVICLCGKLDEVIYEEVVAYENAASEALPMGMDAQDVTRKVEYREVQRIHLLPNGGKIWMSDTQRGMAHGGSDRTERDIRGKGWGI